MRKIYSTLAILMVVVVMCACGSETQAEPSASKPPPEIDLADFTDVVVWDQGIRKTFKRFTRYVLDQYIVQNSCTVSAPKLDDSYRLIMDGNETDCEISFKGDPITRELNQIVVDSPCDTDANTDAFFVAGCSMLSACFDEKYSAEYGVKYFCRMVEKISEEEPMQVSQFGDTKVSVTSSSVGINFNIQLVSENVSEGNGEQEAKEEPASADPATEKKSGNDKILDAYLNRNEEPATTEPEDTNDQDSDDVVINTARHDDDMICICAQDIVKHYLPTPSTAKFCKWSEMVKQDLGNGHYQCTGWVDAQNEYGAMMRYDFLVYYTATEEGYKEGGAELFPHGQ